MAIIEILSYMIIVGSKYRVIQLSRSNVHALGHSLATHPFVASGLSTLDFQPVH